MTALEMGIAGWALAASGFSWLTFLRLEPRPAQGSRDSPGAAPGVLLLRPVDWPTAGELETLATPIDYPGPLEQLVLSPAPISVGSAARWVRSDPATSNRKVGHLLAGLAAVPAAGRFVIAIDADVRVTGSLLLSLIAPLRAGAALSSAAPLPERGSGRGARATRALLLHTHHNFAALDAVRAGPAAVCGKAIALGPAALAELSSVAGCAGEDLELATRLHRARRSVVLAGVPADVPQLAPVSLGSALGRFTRWMVVLRAHRPELYPLVPLLFAPTLPLSALALSAASLPAGLAVAFLVATRAALSVRLSVLLGQGGARGAAGEWLVGEGLLLFSFARSLSVRTVTWRGRRLRVRRGGLVCQPMAGEGA